MVVAIVAYSRRGATEGTLAEVTTVTRTASLQSFVTASGEIVATRFADIGSASMGRLVSLSVKEGDRVKAGQVLAQIDPVQAASSAEGAAASLRALESEASAAATQIKASQAELAAAETRAADAERALKRARELRQAGLIAQSDLDTAQAAADTAAAQVRGAEAAISRLEQSKTAAERRVAQGRAEVSRTRDQLNKTDITAPIDGIITRLDVEQGEMVVIGVQNQPGTILMTVSDLSSINAEVKVAEADVLRLSMGNVATATLEALPGRKFPGKVVEIGASALPQIGTQAAAREFKVKVQLEGELADAAPRPHVRRRDSRGRARQRPHGAPAGGGSAPRAERHARGRRLRGRRRHREIHPGEDRNHRRPDGRDRGSPGRRLDHLRPLPGPARNPGRRASQNERAGCDALIKDGLGRGQGWGLPTFEL